MTSTLTTTRRTLFATGVAVLAAAALASGALAASAAPTVSGSDIGSEWVASDEGPITLGSDPRRPVLSPDGSIMYIPNLVGNSVSIVDTATNTVSLTGAFGGPTSPIKGQLSADGTLLYVLGLTSDEIYVLNVPFFSLADTIPVANDTYDFLLDPDGATIYAQHGSTLTPYDVGSGTAGTSLALPYGSITLAQTPDGSTIFGAAYGDDLVVVVDVATWTVDAATIAAGDAPNAANISPDGSKLYIGNNVSDDVTVIDVASESVDTTIAALDGASDADFSADGRYAYVLGFNAGAFFTIDFATSTIVSTTTTSATPDEITLSRDQRQMYIIDRDTDDAVIYNALELAFTGAGEVAKGQASTSFDLSLLDGNLVNGDYSAENFRVEILDANSVVVSSNTGAVGVNGLTTLSVPTAALPVGTYSVRVSVDGRTLSAVADGLIVAAVLPPTGSDPLPAVAFAASLLVIGAAALMGRRRRA